MTRAPKVEFTPFFDRHSLSPREREILGLLTDGIVGFKEIAAELKVSPSTVNNHFKNIFLKTGTNSKSEVLSLLLRDITAKFVHCRMLSRKPHVMVVDDEPEICRLIHDILTDKGMVVKTFCDPIKAREALNEHRFDAVVCDIAMPGMDGVSLLDEIRKMNRYFPAVVFISGMSRYQPDFLLAKGAVAYMDKPIDFDKLFRLIMERFIEERRERIRFLGIDQMVPTTLNHTLKLSISNLGFGGAFLPVNDSVRDQLKPGDLVSLSFDLEGEAAPIEVKAEVVWKRASGQDGLSPGIGIKFVDINEKAQRQIEEFVRLHRIMSFIPRGAVA